MHHVQTCSTGRFYGHCMERQIERDLRRLFRLTGKPFPGIPDPDSSEPWRAIGAGADPLVIDREAQKVVDRVTASIARHALAGGPHPDVVDRWITDACLTAREDGVETALDAFDAHLRSEPREWRVVAPCPEAGLPQGHTVLQVSGCTIRPTIPEDLELGDQAETAIRGLEGQVITTRVTARDQEAARALAYDQFDVAKAVLAAATGGKIRPRPNTLLINDQGGWWGGGKHRVLLLPWPQLNPPDSERAWDDGWHQLSEAGADPARRSEWAERVLNACRWLYRSRQSWWASERIAMCFFALEALILPEGTTDKARRLSARISDRWTVAGFTKETMRTWLCGLHLDERTNAVHLGRDVRRDLDARRLEDLTAYLVRWGVWHLGDFHRRAGGGCQTVAEVFDGEAHRPDATTDAPL